MQERQGIIPFTGERKRERERCVYVCVCVCLKCVEFLLNGDVSSNARIKVLVYFSV